MKTAFLTPFALVAVLTSSTANAYPFAGAASARKLMAEVLAKCPGASALSFVGSGSDKAEEALLLQQQQIAPMARDLGAALTCQAPSPGEAEGLLVGLDAVAVMAAQTSVGGCTNGFAGGATFSVEDLNGAPGLQCPGCVADQYQLEDWKDALRLVFLGMPHGTFGDLSKQDCNSDVRHSLVNRWSALFGGSCTTGNCSSLAHAFRPGDQLDKTALLLNLLGLSPTRPVNAFCNGVGAPAFPATPNAKSALTDFWDGDPIRRPCDSKDQVCGPDHTLGLVLPISVPDNSPSSTNYPSQPCGFGLCRFLLTNQLVLTCPNGKPQLFGKCFQQVADLGNNQFTAACIPNPGFTCFGGGSQDGRVYNKAVLNPNGTYAVDKAGRANTGAFFRLHSTTARGTGSTCQRSNEMQQLACLTQSTGCSLGVASIDSATGTNGITALPINGVPPTLQNVRKKAISDKEPGAYPMTTRVLFNSMSGVDALTAIAENNLLGCLNSPTLLQTALSVAGMWSLETEPKCVDFDERSCGTTLFNKNACNKRLYNWCPTISGLFVSPTTTSVGGTISLFSSVDDQDGSIDPIDYIWSATSGTFANRFSKTTKFTCTAVGSFEISLAVWDGACRSDASVPVTCVAAVANP